MRRSRILGPCVALAGCAGGGFPGFGDFDGFDTDVFGAGDLDVGAPGDENSVWRPMTGDVMFMDVDAPNTVQSVSAQLPGSQPGADGREMEVFLQIDGDVVVTWAHVEGDAFHWRVTSPIYGSAADGWVGGTPRVTRIWTLFGGHLREQASAEVGTQYVSSGVVYGAVEGPFPPANWPTARVDGPLPEVW